MSFPKFDHESFNKREVEVFMVHKYHLLKEKIESKIKTGEIRDSLSLRKELQVLNNFRTYYSKIIDKPSVENKIDDTPAVRRKKEYEAFKFAYRILEKNIIIWEKRAKNPVFPEGEIPKIDHQKDKETSQFMEKKIAELSRFIIKHNLLQWSSDLPKELTRLNNLKKEYSEQTLSWKSSIKREAIFEKFLIAQEDMKVLIERTVIASRMVDAIIENKNRLDELQIPREEVKEYLEKMVSSKQQYCKLIKKGDYNEAEKYELIFYVNKDKLNSRITQIQLQQTTNERTDSRDNLIISPHRDILAKKPSPLITPTPTVTRDTQKMTVPKKSSPEI